MKYIIMCGWGYSPYNIPKQMLSIGRETVVQRTIRLLRWAGVEDISITTGDDRFEVYKVPIIKHWSRNWVDGFYLVDEPVCYIFGDVVFSHNAIKTIVEAETDDILFFASAPPFAEEYPKKWAEPFAFKVVDYERFRRCIEITKEGIVKKFWWRHPGSWELWNVIKNQPYNHIQYDSYTVINDYTCDVEDEQKASYYHRIDLRLRRRKDNVE